MAVLLLKCDHTVDEHVALRATLQRPEKFHHLGIAAHPVHRLAVHVTPGAKQEAGRLDHVNLGLTGTGERLPAPAFSQAPSSGSCFGRPAPINPSPEYLGGQSGVVGKGLQISVRASGWTRK